VRRAASVELSPAERSELEAWTDRPGPSDRLRMRAQIVLEAAGGRANGEIARQLGIHSETVARWRHRFAVNRIEGLRRDAPRSRGPRKGAPDLVDRILRTTLEAPPPHGTPWTTRSLGRAFNVSHMFVHRVWKTHGLSPSSPAPNPSPSFERPWVDVVGVYIDAPAAALVFAVGAREGGSDEPIAHPRMDPDLSGGFLLPGQHAPASLAGVLSRAEELLPRLANARRSPSELLVFLRSLDESTPPGTELHVVFDRPLEYISDRVGTWLRAHPRFHVRTAPATGSWTATADEWVHGFRDLLLHRDSFRGVAALTESIALAAGAGRPVRGRFSWTLSPATRTAPSAENREPVRGTVPSRSPASPGPSRPAGDNGDRTG
jgi:transposase